MKLCIFIFLFIASIFVLKIISFVLINYSSSILGHEIRLKRNIYKEQYQLISKLVENSGIFTIKFHSRLGWVTREGVNTKEHKINSEGLKSEREYSALPGKNVL